jgi:mannose-6-phosphate isomerase-like protein (cupin superfamily)
MQDSAPPNIQSTFLRLRPDCTVEKLPFDATFWPRLMGGELGDFHHEYLVTCYTYAEDWPSWECHPNGDEIVLMLSGQATFILESPGGNIVLSLERTGDYAFVPRGTWHTAHTSTATTMLFITAGEGTLNRPA